MPITNKIVTRGFGPARDGVGNRAGPVTRGYGGRFIQQIVEIVQRRILRGPSGQRHEDLDEIVISAKMVELNNAPPPKKIEGWIRVRVSGRYVRSLVEHITSRVKQVLVNVSRIK